MSGPWGNGFQRIGMAKYVDESHTSRHDAARLHEHRWLQKQNRTRSGPVHLEPTQARSLRMHDMTSNLCPSLLRMRDVLCKFGPNLSQSTNAHRLPIWKRRRQNQLRSL